jgi:5,5'-dehydrodivanillate O-demethylase
MLSAEKNAQLTAVGPGTPMGELLRRYWMPIAGVSEFERRTAKPVRLLGEDLVLYKDLGGVFGLVDRHCPHRRADMAHGMAENCGLRCSYHGWLFDESGACLEQPYEDLAHPELAMREKIRIKAYPVQEKAGLLWAYLGPQPAPLAPNWEPFTWKNGFVQITISHVPCNWFQAQENSIDPVHFEWQHDNYITRKAGGDRAYGPRHIKVDFEEFEYGFIYKRIVEGRDESHSDWTVGRVCLWPNCLFVGNHFQWRVPVDDTNMLSVTWTYLHVPKEREPFAQASPPTWVGPLTDERGNWIDTHVTNQDIIAWVGQGTIADRTQEHLGPSDKGIVMMRRRCFSEMEAVQAGRDPKGLIRDEAANVCVSLPILHREEHAEGLTMTQIEADPAMAIKMKRFVLQAGQPQEVRAQYEAATGLKMLDDAHLPTRFHQ